jgi:hypothetical protein
MSNQSTELQKSEDKTQSFIEKTASDTISKTISTLLAGGVLGMISALIVFFYGLPFWLYLPVGSAVFCLICVGLFLYGKFKDKKEIAILKDAHELEIAEIKNNPPLLDNPETDELMDLTIDKQVLNYQRELDKKDLHGLENELRESERKLKESEFLLQEEKQNHQRDIISSQTRHEADITILKSDLKIRDKKLNENDWLFKRAQEQRDNIDSYVTLEKFFLGLIEKDDIPHLVFRFQMFNRSLFLVTLDNTIGGHIKFQDKILDGGKRFYDIEIIESLSYKWFDFEYRVSREEMEFIIKNGKFTERDFDISNLIFTIKGADNSDEIKPKQVLIERFFKVWDYQDYERATNKYTGIAGKI